MKNNLNTYQDGFSTRKSIKEQGEKDACFVLSFGEIVTAGRRMAIAILLLGVILFGCKEEQGHKVGEGVVASVKQQELTQEEVADMVPNSSSAEDSVYLAKTYIESWIREQVLLNYAENFLSEEQKDFDEELEKYRTSLIIYAYEKAFLKQNLDTVVSEKDIRDYYNSNPSYFQLKEPIVKVDYFILPDSLDDLAEFKKLFNKANYEKSTELEQYCVDNDAKYYFGDNQWRYLSEIAKKIPLDNIPERTILQKNKSQLIEKNGKLFFLKIVDFMLKGNNSPVSLQEDKIKDIIINQRKIKLLNELHEDTYLQAKDNNLIREYE